MTLCIFIGLIVWVGLSNMFMTVDIRPPRPPREVYRECEREAVQWVREEIKACRAELREGELTRMQAAFCIEERQAEYGSTRAGCRRALLEGLAKQKEE